MEAAPKIRNAVARVSRLRQASQSQPALGEAIARIKGFQAWRFSGTYADLLSDGPYRPAARFFLEELYSDKDYAQRDAQFARIAGAIERIFPAQVAGTAVALAELHALTEELDAAMGHAWLAAEPGDEANRYASSWRGVGRREERELQLRMVMDVGRQMVRLTRAPGLRLMLKMMRVPAAAAGMGALQRLLESGFDTFTAISGRQGTVEEFLRTVQVRESALLALLFDVDPVTSATELARTLGQAR